MGTIIARRRKDGSIGYTGQIRLKRDGSVFHTENRTFDRKRDAQDWIRQRETEVLQAGRHADDPTLGKIIEQMPRISERVFNCNEDAVSAAFTRACKVLGIDGLVFHSLRHEGISRLFEMGWNIPQVAAVSGHQSWAMLQRYTHLKQTGDKYDGWLSKIQQPRNHQGVC